MRTRKLVIGLVALVAVVALAIFASPDAREWGLAALASLVTLILREVDHELLE